MQLADDFIFSQTSLQDYVECPRRFQLRYVERLAWPAVLVEPVLAQEERMRNGSAFHHLVQQHLTGIPENALTPLARNPDLQRWWNSYLLHEPWKIEGRRFIEFTLSAPFHGFRLAAQYDLLVVSADERITVLDWKTSRKKTKRETLAAHLQTRVYQLMAVLAGGRLVAGGAVDPANVEMRYWFSEAPERPEVFRYSEDQYKADAVYLAELIDQICTAEGDLPMTPRLEACRFCVYRSLCERGVGAGSLDEMDESPDEETGLDIDFEQIGEVAF